MAGAHGENVELIASLMTPEDRAHSRALSFGGAGASLAIILLVAQIEPRGIWELVSLCTAGAGMPLWLGMGVGEQIWMLFKLDGRELLAYNLFRRAQIAAYVCAFTLLTVSIGSLLFGMSLLAGALFTMATLFATVGVLLTTGLALRIAERRATTATGRAK